MTSLQIILVCFLIIIIGIITVSYEYFVGSRFDCPTRNQSYDLRGDVYIIPRNQELSPWLNSEIGIYHPEACPRKVLI